MATGLLEVLKLKLPAGALPAPAGGPQAAAPPAAAPAASPAPPVDDERNRNNAKRLIEALSKGFNESITRAQAAVSAQPVASLKKSLGTELDAFATTRAAVDKAEPLDGADDEEARQRRASLRVACRGAAQASRRPTACSTYASAATCLTPT